MTHGCKIGSIAAEFQQQADAQRIVDLEISSHKFQIRLDTSESRCDGFEILAYRGFFDFSRDSIQLLRTLTLLLHQKLSLK